jgi:hypothetical protein
VKESAYSQHILLRSDSDSDLFSDSDSDEETNNEVTENVRLEEIVNGRGEGAKSEGKDND